ncbi:MAG: hypothetical protein K8T90_20105 [Planctomycetes bacterium]|nr:hypothetical protein [Planctomycetota bacterium]
MDTPGARKDPTIAILLSLFFPGAGYAYVGDFRGFLRTLIVVSVLACMIGNSMHGLGFMIVLAVHVFTAIGAGGAARIANARIALDAPPPPPTYTRSAPPLDPAWSSDAPPPPPPAARAPAVIGPPLGADDFLAELRGAWGDRQAGNCNDAQFAERKLSAIERVRVQNIDDGVALLEATSALVAAGVMTVAERSRLKMRVGRP